MLNHNIKGTALEVTPQLRTYVEKKLEHVSRLLENDPSAHTDIELQFKPAGRSKQYRTELTLAHAGGLTRIEEWGATMHEAIDIATAELARELAQTKKKKLHILRRSAGRVKDYLRGWRATP